MTTLLISLILTLPAILLRHVFVLRPFRVRWALLYSFVLLLIWAAIRESTVHLVERGLLSSYWGPTASLISFFVLISGASNAKRPPPLPAAPPQIVPSIEQQDRILNLPVRMQDGFATAPLKLLTEAEKIVFDTNEFYRLERLGANFHYQNGWRYFLDGRRRVFVQGAKPFVDGDPTLELFVSTERVESVVNAPNLTPAPKSKAEVRLIELKRLFEAGLISQEDYDLKRREVLMKEY